MQPHEWYFTVSKNDLAQEKVKYLVASATSTEIKQLLAFDRAHHQGNAWPHVA